MDDALNRRWVVHPFRFRVSDEAEIRLDWEHSEARLDRAGPAGADVRPFLASSTVGAASAFLPQWIEAALDDIRQDRSSGAAELAREALALLSSSSSSSYETQLAARVVRLC